MPRIKARSKIRRADLDAIGFSLIVAILLPATALAQTGEWEVDAPIIVEHYRLDEPLAVSTTEYADRRSRVIAELEDDEGLLFESNELRNRSNDVDFPFRQSSNLLYLTGLGEQSVSLLLLGRPILVDDIETDVVLFVADRDPTHEVWEGVRMGPVVAATVTGIPVVRPSSDIAALRNLVDNAGIILGTRDAASIVDPLRLIKSPAEITLVQRAIDITIEGHRRAMRMAEPGTSEYAIEADMEYAFQHAGAESPAYPSIVGSGPNSCILHYNTNRRRTTPGDLVLMDCGAEYRGYAADITRTFPVDGAFSEEQREIYALVLRAQKAAIKECRDRADFWDPHRKALGILADGLLALGITRTYEAATAYTLHGTSHFLGLDVHDVGRPGRLKPGMILTVEPGIYIPHGSDCDERWWGIGIRIEDDILVTIDDPVNMSAALERELEEIEGLVGRSGPDG